MQNRNNRKSLGVLIFIQGVHYLQISLANIIFTCLFIANVRVE